VDVFLSRLSDQTTPGQLERAALSLLSQKSHIPFTQSPELYSCKIMQIRDQHGCVEYHGLLSIKPDNAAKWFIKHSRSKKVHHKQLLAHQYIRRDSSWRPSYAIEAEHRRPSLKISYTSEEPASLITDGLDTFRREH